MIRFITMNRYTIIRLKRIFYNLRILVCGDETQKPFPLLVWNLASRKLLYDLRIAHHDFITKLAAITYEGNYVCCVAKVSKIFIITLINIHVFSFNLS